eukprot:1064723-Rhodomonas_salina.2
MACVATCAGACAGLQRNMWWRAWWRAECEGGAVQLSGVDQHSLQHAVLTRLSAVDNWHLLC